MPTPSLDVTSISADKISVAGAASLESRGSSLTMSLMTKQLGNIYDSLKGSSLSVSEKQVVVDSSQEIVSVAEKQLTETKDSKEEEKHNTAFDRAKQKAAEVKTAAAEKTKEGATKVGAEAGSLGLKVMADSLGLSFLPDLVAEAIGTDVPTLMSDAFKKMMPEKGAAEDRDKEKTEAAESSAEEAVVTTQVLQDTMKQDKVLGIAEAERGQDTLFELQKLNENVKRIDGGDGGGGGITGVVWDTIKTGITSVIGGSIGSIVTANATAIAVGTKGVLAKAGNVVAAGARFAGNAVIAGVTSGFIPAAVALGLSVKTLSDAVKTVEVERKADKSKVKLREASAKGAAGLAAIRAEEVGLSQAEIQSTRTMDEKGKKFTVAQLEAKREQAALASQRVDNELQTLDAQKKMLQEGSVWDKSLLGGKRWTAKQQEHYNKLTQQRMENQGDLGVLDAEIVKQAKTEVEENKKWEKKMREVEKPGIKLLTDKEAMAEVKAERPQTLAEQDEMIRRANRSPEQKAREAKKFAEDVQQEKVRMVEEKSRPVPADAGQQAEWARSLDRATKSWEETGKKIAASQSTQVIELKHSAMNQPDNVNDAVSAGAAGLLGGT